MVGSFAASLAGHDKGKIYLIIKEEGDTLFLADGELKTINAPKKKNRKHIQPILKYDQEIMEKIKGNRTISDVEVKRAVKLYRRSICQNLM